MNFRRGAERLDANPMRHARGGSLPPLGIFSETGSCTTLRQIVQRVSGFCPSGCSYHPSPFVEMSLPPSNDEISNPQHRKVTEFQQFSFTARYQDQPF